MGKSSLFPICLLSCSLFGYLTQFFLCDYDGSKSKQHQVVQKELNFRDRSVPTSARSGQGSRVCVVLCVYTQALLGVAFPQQFLPKLSSFYSFPSFHDRLNGRLAVGWVRMHGPFLPHLPLLPTDLLPEALCDNIGTP